MAFLHFQSGRTNLSKDLLEMKLRTQGVPGTLSVGGQNLPVLKLRDNLYVTDEKVSPSAKVQSNMTGTDIHQVKGSGDFHHFLQRYKRFDREEKNGKA